MRVTFFVLAMIFVSLNACNDRGRKGPAVITLNEVSEKKAISDHGYVDLEGNKVELSDFKGKRILLNFWATWCRPCIEEMPSLLKAQEILENENYVFLLATDQTIKVINTFRERKGYEFNYLRYTGTFANIGIKALPKTFIYNEDGNKVDEISGAIEWDSPEVIERLKSIK